MWDTQEIDEVKPITTAAPASCHRGRQRLVANSADILNPSSSYIGPKYVGMHRDMSCQVGTGLGLKKENNFCLGPHQEAFKGVFVGSSQSHESPSAVGYLHKKPKEDNRFEHIRAHIGLV